MKTTLRPLLSVALFGSAALATAATPKPNILFIAVDDLRPQLGCYGEKQMISPHIDRLAKTGVIFTNAYCQVPVCGASRASLLTGLRPTPTRFINYDAWAEKDAPGIVDLPGWLKRQGYETFSLGKVYHFTDDNQKSWTQLGSPLITREQFPDYQLPESRAPKGTKGWGGGLAYEMSDTPDEAHYQGQVTNAAIARLREMKQTARPGFLAVGLTKPHLPFVAPKKYWDLYKREKLVPAANPFRPKNAPNEAMHDFNEIRNYRGIPQKGPIPADLALTLQHGYYACVSFTDAMVGRLLDELDRLGMRENTIVILWGDHGWQLGEHALWCKHAHFETSLRAPLILRAPGYPAGTTTKALVEFVDIYPTLCELAGLPLPGHLEGTSVVPLLKDPARAGKQAVFSRYIAGDSVRTDRYRYTEWNQKGVLTARMLYDLEKDPLENTNIVDTEEGRAVAAKLSALLQSTGRTAR